MPVVGWARVRGEGSRGASVSTAVACPGTAAGAAGAPPGCGLCAVLGASPIASPRDTTSLRHTRGATPRLRQERVLFVMPSSCPMVGKAPRWLWADRKQGECHPCQGTEGLLHQPHASSLWDIATTEPDTLSQV